MTISLTKFSKQRSDKVRIKHQPINFSSELPLILSTKFFNKMDEHTKVTWNPRSPEPNGILHWKTEHGLVGWLVQMSHSSLRGSWRMASWQPDAIWFVRYIYLGVKRSDSFGKTSLSPFFPASKTWRLAGFFSGWVRPRRVCQRTSSVRRRGKFNKIVSEGLKLGISFFAWKKRQSRCRLLI